MNEDLRLVASELEDLLEGKRQPSNSDKSRAEEQFVFDGQANEPFRTFDYDQPLALQKGTFLVGDEYPLKEKTFTSKPPKSLEGQIYVRGS